MANFSLADFLITEDLFILKIFLQLMNTFTHTIAAKGLEQGSILRLPGIIPKVIFNPATFSIISSITTIALSGMLSMSKTRIERIPHVGLQEVIENIPKVEELRNPALDNFVKTMSYARSTLAGVTWGQAGIYVLVFTCVLTSAYILFSFASLVLARAGGKLGLFVAEHTGLEKLVKRPETPEDAAGIERIDKQSPTNPKEYNTILTKIVGKTISILNITTVELFWLSIYSCLTTVVEVIIFAGTCVAAGYFWPGPTGGIVKPHLEMMSKYSANALEGLQGISGMSFWGAAAHAFYDWLVVLFFILQESFTNISYLTSTLVTFVLLLTVLPTLYALTHVNRSEGVKKMANFFSDAVKKGLMLLLGAVTFVIFIYFIRMFILMYPSVQQAFEYVLSMVALGSKTVLYEIGSINNVTPVEVVTV